MENIKDKILEEYKKGNIVIKTPIGLLVYKIDDIINQSAEGLLYDLNRDETTILTFIDNTKWINDYACAMVIRHLMEKLNNKKE